jgi:zinc transport system substrate-binding protein
MRAGTVPTLLALLALAAGCAGDDSRSGTQVVAAFYPIAYAADRLAPGAEVENLTPAGTEPHDLELSPRDVEKVAGADVVLYLGQKFMPALEDAVAGRDNAVDLLAGEELQAPQDAGAANDESRLDPHVWLDPVRYAAMVRTIARELDVPAAADDLVAQLEQLDGELRSGLSRCRRREIVTSHAAFGYLARAYGLVQIPLTGVSPEAEPSARAIERLVDQVREHGATTVFFETLVSPRLAETVAREADVGTAVLDPLEGLTDEEAAKGADYFSVMRANLAALRQALGCS